MRFLNKTTWQKVFQSWEEREADNPGWIKCATEIKGWPDWQSWRRHSASQIKAEDREWALYKFENPEEEILQMLVGPYSGWQKDLPEKNKLTFSEILEIPEINKKFFQHDGVLSIIKSLPFETEMIGLLREDNKIVCLEGHHRAMAIALAQKQNKNINYKNTSIKIALAKIKNNELHLLDEMLKRGSMNK